MNTESPKTLSDICGAERIGSLVPVVIEFAAGTEVLDRGSVISTDATGKGVLVGAGTENQGMGILLDESLDTAQSLNGVVTGTVARHGSFKASQLIVGAGTDLLQLVPALRQNGIYLEGSLTVPAAAATAVAHKPHKTH